MMDQAQKLRSMVRSQSQPASARNLARVITITSGKGGVGKSSISVNLAIAFAQMGKRVVVLDADFGLANVEIMLGIRPAYNLADMMFRGKKLREVVTQGPENIGFISGGSGIQEMTNLTKEQLLNLSASLRELDQMADIILIDTGAGISDSVMEFVLASSEILLVATPEPTSITDAYALLKTLNKRPEYLADHSGIKLIVNRVRDQKEGQELYQKLNIVTDKFLNFSLQHLGSIPQDNHIVRAVMAQKPLVTASPGAPASRAIIEMAEKLIGLERTDGKAPKKGISGLFASVLARRM